MGEQAQHLESAVAQRMKAKNLRYVEALVEICSELPDLWERYSEEVLGRKIRHDSAGDFEVLVISHDPQRQLDEMIAARMKETGVSYKVALTEIGQEHPEVWEAASRQVLTDDFSKH
jgi:hypothetical protein